MKNIPFLFATIIVINIVGSCKKEISTNNKSTNAVPIDADGNVYDTVRICNQVWMKENLKTSHYRDGSVIVNGIDSIAWANSNSAQIGAWSDYGGDITNDIIYGKLYNWYSINDSRNICPQGWHVPSALEWKTMINCLGGDTLAGGAMKSTSNLWRLPNGNATNTSGFTALPAGSLYITFYDLGGNAYFWSSTANSSGYAWYWGLNYEGGDAYQGPQGPDNFGLSCRCVRDE